jgi:hypothetical protein
MTRAVLSLLPPGADEAMSSTAFVGCQLEFCAAVTPAYTVVATQHALMAQNARRFSSMTHSSNLVFATPNSNMQHASLIIIEADTRGTLLLQQCHSCT